MKDIINLIDPISLLGPGQFNTPIPLHTHLLLIAPKVAPTTYLYLPYLALGENYKTHANIDVSVLLDTFRYFMHCRYTTTNTLVRRNIVNSIKGLGL